MYRSVLLLLLTVALPSQRLLGTNCPAFVKGDQVPGLVGADRGQVRLFTAAAGGWQELPLQIDPMNQDGVLRDAVDVQDEQAAVRGFDPRALTRRDRLAFYPDAFGDGAPRGKPPCDPAALVEVHDRRRPGARAWLARCRQKTPPRFAGQPVVRHAARRLISSPRYQYFHTPENEMVYEKIYAVRDQSRFALTGAAAMLLRLDIKKFFTMEFDRDDVRAELVHSRSGPLGMVNRLGMSINLMGFNIALQMDSMMSFYETSINVPMQVDVPAHAPDYLHEGSGVLAMWIPVPGTRFLRTGAPGEMVDFHAPSSLAGYRTIGKRGAGRCRARTCYFHLDGILDKHGVKFRLQVSIARKFVKLGFLPQFIQDVPKFLKVMEWDDDPDPHKGVVALYFSNTGMPKGYHTFDHWIYIVSGNEPMLRCPHPVTVKDAA